MIWKFLEPITRVTAVPTVVHATHAKAGSSWIRDILAVIFREHVAPRGPWVAKDTGGDLSKHVFEPGRIYPAMFMTREEVLAHSELDGAARFFVLRDLRDTLVSLYFSLKVSHPLDESGKKKAERETLQALSMEDGLLHLIERHLRRVSTIQRSWLDCGEIVLRYEDLLKDDVLMITDLIRNRLGVKVSSLRIAQAVKRRRFESVFKRKLGSEDVSSHGRKGEPGDWKNHFTPAVCDAFRERYGDLLIASGYEKDGRWAEATANR